MDWLPRTFYSHTTGHLAVCLARPRILASCRSTRHVFILPLALLRDMDVCKRGVRGPVQSSIFPIICACTRYHIYVREQLRVAESVPTICAYVHRRLVRQSIHRLFAFTRWTWTLELTEQEMRRLIWGTVGTSTSILVYWFFLYFMSNFDFKFN